MYGECDVPYRSIKQNSMGSYPKNSKKIPNWLMQAREKWAFYGQERPDFATIPEKGQVSVWDFPRPPALVKESRTLKVAHNDTMIAMSKQALAVQETASPPTYYVPPEDVALTKLLQMAGKSSLCEWKGSTVYWALRSEPEKAIAWSYPDPFPPFEPLADHLAFYPQYLACYLNEERVTPQPGGFYAGWITKELVGPFKGEPGTGHW